MRVIVLLILAVTHTKSEEEFLVRKLNNSGIIFERMHDIAFYSETRIIVTSITPSNMEQIIKNLNIGKARLKQLCTQLREIEEDNTCNNFVEEIRIHINDIELHNTIILHKSGREKRSLVDVVGTISKSLFGTMDNEDSNKIYNDLQNLHENEDHIFKVVKDQIAVVKSNFDTLTKPIQSLSAEVKEINAAIENINEESGQALNQQNRTNYILFINEKFLETSNLLLLKCTIATKQQNRIIEILNSARTNKLHPMILSTKEVSDTIQKMIQNQSLEINEEFLTPSHLNQVAEIDHLEVNGTIIIKIEIPLPEKETYELFKAFITPIEVNNKWAVYEIEADLVAANPTKTKFIELKGPNLLKCKDILLNLNYRSYVCKHQNPIITNSKNDCLLTLFHNPFEDEQNCVMKHTEERNSITKLVDQNSWLFLIHSPIKMMIKCKKSNHNIILNSSKIVSFNANCELITKDFTLPTTGSKIQTLEIYQPPEETVFPLTNNIKFLNDRPEKQKNTKTKIMQFSQHNDDIARERDKITELQKLADDEHRFIHSRRDTTWKTVGWWSTIPLTIAIFILTICSFKKLKSRICSKKQNNKRGEIINLTSIQINDEPTQSQEIEIPKEPGKTRENIKRANSTRRGNKFNIV